MERITLLGIDLAKNIFEIRGVGQAGRSIVNRRLERKDLAVFTAKLPPCRIVMEACGGAHYWGRLFQSQGHEVDLIAAQFVKPFKNTRQKNDQVDVAAIVEAAQRPSMRYVSVKNLFQQDIQSMHRVRDQLVKSRTSISNQIRGLLMEYGCVLSEGVEKFQAEFPAAIEDPNNSLTSVIRDITRTLYELFSKIIQEEDFIEKKIRNFMKGNEDYNRLLKIPGVGPLTASLFVACVGNASVFKNGRHVSAWLGLVPRQTSSGETNHLGRITKSGDGHLRMMLVQGARSALQAALSKQKTDPMSQWMLRLKQEKGWHKASVALASRNARIMCRLVKYQENYEPA